MFERPVEQALLRGDWPFLRECDESVVELELVRWLEEALDGPETLDPDRLIGRGINLGRARRRDVDRMVLRWLRRVPVDEPRLGVALGVLSGFWSACPTPIPADRIDGLLDLADEVQTPTDGLHYGLLEALASALRSGISDPARARERVESLAARRWPAGIDQWVARVAARALE